LGDSIKINIIYNKDFISVCGDNGSGKTTLVEKLILSNIPPEKIFVLNSSNEGSWYQYVPKNNVITPIMFTKEFFERFLLEFVSRHSDCMLVLDDIDNYNIKRSEVLKSVVINARHLNIGIVITTRSLQDLPIILYRQSKYAFLSRQISQYDRIYISTMVGLENSRKLGNLDKYVFGVYSRDFTDMQFIKLSV